MTVSETRQAPRVLAVDDQAVVCESIRRVLAEDGYQVTTTTSPDEAIALLAAQEFDVLFTDLRMSGKSGIEILEAARSVSPTTQVILVTDYASLESTMAAMRLGAADYLEKPVAPSTLLVAAARAVERREMQMLIAALRAENAALRKTYPA